MISKRSILKGLAAIFAFAVVPFKAKAFDWRQHPVRYQGPITDSITRFINTPYAERMSWPDTPLSSDPPFVNPDNLTKEHIFTSSHEEWVIRKIKEQREQKSEFPIDWQKGKFLNGRPHISLKEDLRATLRAARQVS